MERISIQVRPEDLRHVAITCRCKHRSTAEVPEQLAKSLNAHICPNCGTIYKIRLNENGNVTGTDGRKWSVSRGPSVEDVSTMDADNVMEALNASEQRQELASTDPHACPFCNGKGRLLGGRCGNCKGSGHFDKPIDKEKVN